MLAITERRAERGVEENTVVVGNASYTAEQLRNAIIKLKQAIAKAIDRKVSIDTHQRFVTSVHRPLRVGRQGISQPVDYLVLNYDTIVEDSLAMARIPYADGLSGGATAWWDASAFDADGVSARVIKLHGSINWYQFPDDPLPRRIGTSIELENQTNIPLLIWPSSTKYQEAQLDPFAQLLNRARIALRPSSGSQRLLVICGYSFGDKHINLEIDRALHESGGNLTIAAFTDRNEPCGLLQAWREDNLVRDQVLVFSNRGFFHGDKEHISDRRLALVEVRESDTYLERRCVNMAGLSLGEPIENLAIGKIIEVDGSRIIAELDADLTELSRIYGGEVYPIGQFGSIVRVHFGRRLNLCVCWPTPHESRVRSRTWYVALNFRRREDNRGRPLRRGRMETV